MRLVLHVYVCVSVCMYTYIETYMYKVRMRLLLNIYVCMHVYKYIYMCMRLSHNDRKGHYISLNHCFEEFIYPSLIVMIIRITKTISFLVTKF